MNVLKTSDLIDQSEFDSLFKKLGLDLKLDILKTRPKSVRFFDMTYAGTTHVTVSPVPEFALLDTLSKLATNVSDDLKSVLKLMLKPQKFNLKHTRKIVGFMYLDWIIAGYQLRYNASTPDTSKILNQFLALETGIDNLIKSTTESEDSDIVVRSTLMTYNKQSTIVDLVGTSSQLLNLLTDINLGLIRKNKLISLIEIPEGFDNEKLTLFLKQLNLHTNRIIKANPAAPDHKFELKLRKIKRTYKKGIYLPAVNTIIVDPRHTESLVHEMGHWYHTHFDKSVNTRKKAEEFADKFDTRKIG